MKNFNIIFILMLSFINLNASPYSILASQYTATPNRGYSTSQISEVVVRHMLNNYPDIESNSSYQQDLENTIRNNPNAKLFYENKKMTLQGMLYLIIKVDRGYNKDTNLSIMSAQLFTVKVKAYEHQNFSKEFLVELIIKYNIASLTVEYPLKKIHKLEDSKPSNEDRELLGFKDKIKNFTKETSAEIVRNKKPPILKTHSNLDKNHAEEQSIMEEFHSKRTPLKTNHRKIYLAEEDAQLKRALNDTKTDYINDQIKILNEATSAKIVRNEKPPTLKTHSNLDENHAKAQAIMKEFHSKGTPLKTNHRKIYLAEEDAQLKRALNDTKTDYINDQIKILNEEIKEQPNNDTTSSKKILEELKKLKKELREVVHQASNY